MQELIKIEKRIIGAEETNSVNGRDLHKALEIKKQYSDWINAQIKRAGLRENVDYVTLKVAGSNGRPSKEYILTTDSSKHIAMMSQGQKAKEVRDYFIAVEKEYKASLHTDERSMFMEFMKNQQRINANMMQFMEHIATTQEKILELLVKQEQKQIANSLTRDQLDNIKRAVLKAAKPLADVHRFSMGRAIKEVYSEMNGRMGVFTYYHILPSDYDEAIALLEKLQKEKENALVALKLKEKLDEDNFEMPQF